MSDSERISAIFQALSDPLRIQLLLAVGTRSPSASDLVRTMRTSQPRVAHHLKILVDAGLLKAERRGRFVHYTCLTGGEAGLLLEALFQMASGPSSFSPAASSPVSVRTPRSTRTNAASGSTTGLPAASLPVRHPAGETPEETKDGGDRPGGLEDYLL